MKSKLIERMIRRNLNEYSNEQDWLFRGITYDDLITAVESNESNITPETIKKTFREMYQANYTDALSELNANTNKLIKRIKG